MFLTPAVEVRTVNEETTRNLNAQSFEERIFHELTAMRAEMTTMNGRLAALEGKVDARLRETRPIWEAVQARLDKIEPTLKEMASHLKLLAKDSFQLRARIEELAEHIPPAA